MFFLKKFLFQYLRINIYHCVRGIKWISFIDKRLEYLLQTDFILNLKYQRYCLLSMWFSCFFFKNTIFLKMCFRINVRKTQFIKNSQKFAGFFFREDSMKLLIPSIFESTKFLEKKKEVSISFYHLPEFSQKIIFFQKISLFVDFWQWICFSTKP